MNTLAISPIQWGAFLRHLYLRSLQPCKARWRGGGWHCKGPWRMMPEEPTWWHWVTVKVSGEFIFAELREPAIAAMRLED